MGDMAFLDAHDAECFRAIGTDAVLFAGRHDRIGDGFAIARRHAEFISQFAREGDAEEPALQIAAEERDGARAHEREGGIRDILVHDLGEDGAGFRAGNGHLRPLVGRGGEVHLQLRPERLGAEFQMGEHTGGERRCGGHEEMIVAEAARRAVIVDHTVFSQHDAVARLADGEPGEAVAIDPVEESGGVLAEDLDLAERRDVAKPGIFPDIQHFAIDAVAPRRFARAREPGGAIPEAGFHEGCAVLLRPVMQRRLAHRLEMLAARCARERAEGDGRVERAEGRRADFARRDAAGFGQNADGIDVGKLALIGRHAVGRVALGKLDIAIAFADGKTEILEVHVVLVIDEGLALAALGEPEGRGGRLRSGGLRKGWFDLREAEGFQCFGGLASTVAQACFGRPETGSGPGNRQALLPLRREEGGVGVRPHGFRTAMAGQMNDGTPAAGHGDRIGLKPLDAGRAGNADAADRLAAQRIDDVAIGQHFRLAVPAGFARAARINDCRHLDTRGLKIGGGSIARIVGSEDHDTLARRDRLTVQIAAHRACHHDTRNIVAAEDEGAFFRAACQDCLFRDDAPQPFDRLA